MVVGILPLVMVLGWIAVALYNPPRHDSGFFMLDPIAMIGVLMMTYAFAVIVGGLGLFQSFSVTRQHHELRSKTVGMLQAAVILALAAPLLWNLGMQYKVL